MSFILLWAFFDKLFGLGFSTSSDKSWLHGISPTTGFLKFGTKGVFSDLFQSLAGNSIIDWLFMMGLLFIGICLLLGIGMKIAGYAGALLMFLLYLSVFPSKDNPLIDEHIIYLIILLGLSNSKAGRKHGLGIWWSTIPLIKHYKFLQ
jgi:thiosulfate dehydrogenase [quinone] large subunit